MAAIERKLRFNCRDCGHFFWQTRGLVMDDTCRTCRRRLLDAFWVLF